MDPRKLVLALALFMLPALAHAGCSVGALPFILQNNTVADATQVDADFNQITSGINSNCAASGANNDITSLSALSTPLSPIQGGSPVFAGGTTTGSANAQTITTIPTGTPTALGGLIVTGQWGFTNTAFMTISVNGGTPTAVYRSHQNGVSPTAGGEAIAGHPFVLLYNSTINVFKLISETFIIGEMKTIAAASIPPGWFIADGSTFVCANFTDLCNVIGVQFGGTASNPKLPDTRGAVMTGLDNYNTYGSSQGAAGRLNNIITGCGTSFTLIGVSCANASERHFQAVNELAVHNHGITDPGHGHNVNDPGHTHVLSQLALNSAGGATVAGGAAGISTFNTMSTNTTGITNGTNVTGITINNNGSGAAMPIVNPNLGMIMIIRF